MSEQFALSVAASTLPPCRECQEGKHGNCDGDTWDDVGDDYAPCPCADRGHVITPTAPPA